MQGIKAPEQLQAKIMNRIGYEQELLKLKRRLFFYALVLASSVSAFAVYMIIFWQQINQSGFLQMFGLLFSDLRIITANFSDYILSLAESLPMLTAGFLGVILLFVFASAVKIFRYTTAIKKLRVG